MLSVVLVRYKVLLSLSSLLPRNNCFARLSEEGKGSHDFQRRTRLGCMSEQFSHFNNVSVSTTLCTYCPDPIYLSVRILGFIWSNSNGRVAMDREIVM